MVTHKHIHTFVTVIVAVAVCICLLAMGFSDQITELLGGKGVTMAYEKELFDTSEIISLNIIMDEEEWQLMLDNAIDEEYYQCDVVINGTTFYSVGIRPKGNTSLSAVVNDPTSNRYSFKLEFDRYVAGQTCWGLDKLVLNNNYADASNLKEAIVYDMFAYLDADAPRYNYADISLNGENWGVYLALEAVEESFLLRNYGTTNGDLYKPEGIGGGGGNRMMGNMGQEFGRPDFINATNSEEDAQKSNTQIRGNQLGQESTDRNNQSGGIGPVGLSSGGGSNLNYIDDELDSYSTIWDGDKTSSKKSTKKQVVEALKNISEGNNLEAYMDVDNVLKYLAIHTFSVNLDSLSGSMEHNYYLYAYNGQLNILPWDYNLAFGAFNMDMGMLRTSTNTNSGASSTINFPIDTPFSSSISLEDRRFFSVLLENETYLSQYHEYLSQLVEKYIEGGQFENVYNRIRTQIDTLVQADPNAFYEYDEYDAGANMLYNTILLRAESVAGQLAGTIPATHVEQTANQTALIDASDIDIDTMGVFNMGGGNRMQGNTGNANGGRGERPEWGANQDGDLDKEGAGNSSEEFKGPDMRPSENTNSNMPSSEKPIEGTSATPNGGMSERPSNSNRFQNMPPENSSEALTDMRSTGYASQAEGYRTQLILYGLSLGMLIAGFMIAKFTRKRRHILKTNRLKQLNLKK